MSWKFPEKIVSSILFPKLWNSLKAKESSPLESKELESRRDDSEVALEGALSIVNGLNLGDFEKEWKA